MGVPEIPLMVLCLAVECFLGYHWMVVLESVFYLIFVVWGLCFKTFDKSDCCSSSGVTHQRDTKSRDFSVLRKEGFFFFPNLSLKTVKYILQRIYNEENGAISVHDFFWNKIWFSMKLLNFIQRNAFLVQCPLAVSKATEEFICCA